MSVKKSAEKFLRFSVILLPVLSFSSGAARRVQLVAGALHFAHGRGFGLDLRLEVEGRVDITPLYGRGADLVGLEIFPEHRHGERRLDVCVEEVDIDGGVVRLGIGVDAEMGVFAEAGDGDLPLVFVEEGVVQFDAEALRRGIDEGNQQICRVDDAFPAAVAVDQKMTADVVFHEDLRFFND